MAPLERSISTHSESSSIRSGPTEPTKTLTNRVEKNHHHHHRRRRRVRFNIEKNDVFIIDHIADMSPEAMAETWYHRREYEEMRYEMHLVIKRMRNLLPIFDDGSCTTRGLEKRTKQARIQCLKIRASALDVVLEEQDRQQDMGTINVERLANVYQKYALPCAAEARAMGMADETAVARLNQASSRSIYLHAC